MKAVMRDSYGSPGILRVSEMPRNEINSNEVMVRVYATTINRTDTAILTGKPLMFRFVTGIRKPKRLIPGTDFAGCIEAIGEEVTKFQVGDRVWGFHDEGLSSQANYLSISEDAELLRIPAGLAFNEIVACAEGAHYAVNFVNKVNIESGSKVLVNGATGAIGSALLQILKYQEAEITAVGNTKNLKLLRALGADRVIDYTTDDFLASADKYHFIFDAVGKSSYFKCRPLLLNGGVYISSELGNYAQNLYLPLITKVFGRCRVVFPFPSDIKASLSYIVNLIEKGCFKAVVDREYTLSEVQQAYEYVLSGEKTGNVVLNIETE